MATSPPGRCRSSSQRRCGLHSAHCASDFQSSQDDIAPHRCRFRGLGVPAATGPGAGPRTDRPERDRSLVLPASTVHRIPTGTGLNCSVESPPARQEAPEFHVTGRADVESGGGCRWPWSKRRFLFQVGPGISRQSSLRMTLVPCNANQWRTKRQRPSGAIVVRRGMLDVGLQATKSPCPQSVVLRKVMRGCPSFRQDSMVGGPPTVKELPPGQYETFDFPVLSAGPTPVCAAGGLGARGHHGGRSAPQLGLGGTAGARRWRLPRPTCTA